MRIVNGIMDLRINDIEFQSVEFIGVESGMSVNCVPNPDETYTNKNVDFQKQVFFSMARKAQTRNGNIQF